MVVSFIVYKNNFNLCDYWFKKCTTNALKYAYQSTYITGQYIMFFTNKHNIRDKLKGLSIIWWIKQIDNCFFFIKVSKTVNINCGFIFPIEYNLFTYWVKILKWSINKGILNLRVSLKPTAQWLSVGLNWNETEN